MKSSTPMIREIGLNIHVFTVKLIDTIFSIFMILIFAKRTKRIKRQFKKDCIILGNGPSLKEDLFSLEKNISSSVLICVNDFALSELYSRLKPHVYVFLDPFYWQELDVDVPYHLYNLKQRNEVYNRIMRITDWPIIIYAPFEFKYSTLYKESQNDFITFSFFNTIPVQGFKWLINTVLNNGLGLLKSANVITPCLYYAIMSDFKTIYLCGVDHTWINSIVVLEDSIVYMAQTRFYDNESAQYKPFYFVPNDDEPAKLHELLKVYSNVFNNYWILADFAKEKKLQIINLTKKSHIDAFPKK